ncbi:hypothetical protein TIFTF001_031331 [Ficus carica]|uniref:Uncharacterized protein n=1 Tax=Ficus carica TaxID=3494 RepID=A0AA88J656_FICCA|nr:hypothetical protein TIFTF001_031331 [Ficus carica]
MISMEPIFALQRDGCPCRDSNAPGKTALDCTKENLCGNKLAIAEETTPLGLDQMRNQ